MYVFFDAECTQDLERHEGTFVHVPNLKFAHQMCSKYEAVDDMNVDCEQCSKRTPVFWQNNVGKFINYLRLSRLFADKIYILSHNSRRYEEQFLLRRFLELRWKPQLIMEGSKFLSMVVENVSFLDSLNFLPMSLKSMPKSFDLHARRDTILTLLIWLRIWIMWALIQNPSSMGQTKCKVM